MTSLYDDLGAAKDADTDALKRAHRAASMRHHPDRGGDPEDFQRVSRAWMVLRDPEKRAKYDRDGTVDDQPDNSASAMAGLLTAAFDAAMAGCQGRFEEADIMVGMKSHLRQQLTGLEAQKLEATTARARYAKARKRLRFKGGGNDLLGAVLDQRVGALDQALAAMAQQKAAIVAAMARLEDYGWEFAAPPPPQPFFNNTNVYQSMAPDGLGGWTFR